MTRLSGITSAGALACSEGGVRPSFGETAAFAPYDAAKTPLLRVDIVVDRGAEAGPEVIA